MSKIFRGEVTNNFSIIHNEGANRKDLTWKAKGLLWYLLSRPDDWNIYLTQLSKVGKDGRDATAGALKELQQAGYVVKKVAKDKNGKLDGWDWYVFATVENANKFLKNNGISVTRKTRNTENPTHGKPDTTNNRNKLNNNSTKNLNIELPFSSNEFAEAWQDWQQHRKEKKKKLTPTSIKKQFKELKEIGEERAIKAINHSIAQGYTGIFEPKGNQNSQVKQTYSPTKVYG